MATIPQPVATESTTGSRIPWYLWCSVLAVTSVTIGSQWDVSWHRSIGRDTFWTPAHLAIYLCGVLAGIACGYLILSTTFLRSPDKVANAVHAFGFGGPLGAFLAAWGGVAMLTSAPFDNWWHNAYGLDVKIVSPPHTLLILGVVAVEVGSLFLILAAMNRAENQPVPFRHLQRLFLYIAGLLLMMVMFFMMEFTSDVQLHMASPYIIASMGVPFCYAVAGNASRHRWAATWITTLYTAAWIAIILILPLFPAEPKLGPVFQPVTHLVPPKFPLLLIVPAVLLDLTRLLLRDGSKLLVAILSGPIFVLSLVAAEWPFADFLLSKTSQNRFFATAEFSYGAPSWSAEVSRHFVRPEHGLMLWKGLGIAILYAAAGTWLGSMLGGWMRKIKR
jgi:hypothetical protein